MHVARRVSIQTKGILAGQSADVLVYEQREFVLGSRFWVASFVFGHKLLCVLELFQGVPFVILRAPALPSE